MRCGGAGPGWADMRAAPLPPRQRELLFRYLQLVAAVEQHQLKFRSQATVIDEIVDTTFEVRRAEGRS